MSTETVLLLIILLGAIAATPGALALRNSQRSRLTLVAAQQLETELQVRMSGMHERIVQLEEENRRLATETHERIVSLEADNEKLRNRLTDLQRGQRAMEKRNVELVRIVKQLVAQLEHHELAPDVDVEALNRVLS